jgi:hypothetical protein
MSAFGILIGYTVLLVLLFIPTLIFGCLSLCFGRRNGDRARSAFTWLKVGICIFMSALAFNIISAVLSIVVTYTDSDLFYDNEYDFFLASALIGIMSGLLFLLTNQVVVMMLVVLGLGILLARTGSPSKLHGPVKFAALALSVILTILSIAWFGVRVEVERRRYFRSFRRIDFSTAKLDASATQLNAAVTIINFATSVALIGFAILVLIKIGKNKAYPHLKPVRSHCFLCPPPPRMGVFAS